MLTLASPWWLFALPLPFILWYAAARARHPRRHQPETAAALLHSQADRLVALSAGRPPHRTIPWLWLAGCTLLVMAMTRPQWLDFASPANHRGHNIMLAIDVSGSMRAQDFVIDGVPVSRLDMLKRVVKEFLMRRKNDRFGVIVFADEALPLVPLTSDLAMVSTLLDETSNGIAGEKTALGDAIALAVDRLRHRPPASRLLLLLTDGANTSGAVSPVSAALIAKLFQVRIYTIGVGSDRTVLFPRGPVQSPLYTELPLDEPRLRAIAQATGGHYYRAGGAGELQRILRDIGRLETVKITDPAQAEHHEWYALPLAGGLLMLALAELRRRREILPS